MCCVILICYGCDIRPLQWKDFLEKRNQNHRLNDDDDVGDDDDDDAADDDNNDFDTDSKLNRIKTTNGMKSNKTVQNNNTKALNMITQ